MAGVLFHNRSVRLCGLGLMILLLAAWLVVSGCPGAAGTRTTGGARTSEPPSRGPDRPAEEAVMRAWLTKVGDHPATVAVDGPVRIFGDASQPIAQSANLAECELSVAPGPVWRLGSHRIAARRLALRLERHGTFQINKQVYRGDLCLYPDGPANFIAVDELGMEDYVAGVVTAESYADYPVEALKAQAIIARTYAMCEKLIHPDREFDVTDDTNSQVYGGVAREGGVGRRVTDATRGVMLVYGSPGQEKVFWTFYSSTCAGGNMSVRYFRPKIQEIPPLAGGVACPWCRDSRWFNWETIAAKYKVVTIPHAEAWAKLHRFNPQLAEDGRNVRVVPGERDAFGRMLTVKLVCESWPRPVVMLADELRLTLGAKLLPSMMVEMTDTGSALVFRNGHGNGHGVGLCQVGAAGMARAGRSAEAILGHYYPQAMIKRAY